MRMKKVLMIACALFMGASAVNAQNTELPKDGDLFQGLTRSITYDRMIPPHGLQVTFDKYYLPCLRDLRGLRFGKHHGWQG